MDLRTLVPLIIEHFQKEFRVGLPNSGGDNIKLDTTTYNSRQFLAQLKKEEAPLCKKIGRGEYFMALDKIGKEKKWDEDRVYLAIAAEVLTGLRKGLVEARSKKYKGDVGELEGNAYKYADRVVVLDRQSSTRLIYNVAQKCIDHGTDYDTWKEYRSHRSKDEREAMSSTVMVAEIEYNPFDPTESYSKDVNDQKDILHLNAHKTPEWRKMDVSAPKLPPMFKKIMQHIFPDKDSLDYVFHWMNFMLTDRNYCFLLMHGDRGIGKNCFYTICRLLAGPENSTELTSGFFKNRFNGELKNRRLIFMDEHDILADELSTWKQLPEKHLAIESKNGKVHTVVNHASFLVANNTEAQVDLLCDERKFSVPIIGKEKLEDELGSEALDDFMRDLEDNQEVLANVGHWILKYGNRGKYCNRKPFKSELFYDIVDRALKEWQRYIVELIEKREYDEIDLNFVSEQNHNVGRTKIAKFLETHRDRDGDRYGSVKQKSGGARFLIPNDKYMPEIGTEKKEEENIEDIEF